MRSATFVALLFALGGCAAKAKPTVAAPAAPVLAPAGKPPAPEGPSWPSVAPSLEVPVRATTREEIPLEDPERLVRDLADAKACVEVRIELARLVSAGLARVRPPVSPQAAASVRAGLERTVVPGCSIARRECRDDGRRRRWCWSEAVLDSSVARHWVRREFRRIDSTRVEALLAEVLRPLP